MKQFFKIIVFGFFGLYFKYRFRRCTQIDRKKKIYLFDIDNTLADTWPSLRDYVYRNENHRYESLSIFRGMRNFIINKIADNEKVIFISARSYLNYLSTLKWLRSNGLPADSVILVERPIDKLDYIRELLSRNIEVVYVDDLSHSHEFGEMKLYDNLIMSLRDLPIAYIGIDEIELINSTYEINNPDTEKGIPNNQNYLYY